MKVSKKTEREICSRLQSPNRAQQSLDNEYPSIFDWTQAQLMLEFHPLCDENDFDWPEEQTFREFEEMVSCPPNQSGTGRNRLTRQRQTIVVMNLCKRRLKQKMERLILFLKLYVRMNVVLSSTSDGSIQLDVSKRGKEAHIVDKTKGLLFPLQVVAIEDEDEPGKKHVIEVFSIFAVLVEYVSACDYSVVAIVWMFRLARKVQRKVKKQWRFWVVLVATELLWFRTATTFRTWSFLALLLMGFDHTTFFRCLMNPSAVGQTLFLAPHNLKKLQHFHGGGQSFALDRFREMEAAWWKVFRPKDDQAKQQFDWLRRKIISLETLGKQSASRNNAVIGASCRLKTE